MAGSVRINHAGARQLLQSPEVMKELRKYGDQVAATAAQILGGPPESYAIEEWVGQNRARVSVWTDSKEARIAEAQDHVLLQALNVVLK